MKWLIDRFSSAGQAVAFIHDGVKATYEEVAHMVSEFSGELKSRGVKAGDRVVIAGDYSPEVFCLLLAVCRLGGIAIPLSASSIIEKDTALSVSGCDFLVAFDADNRTWTVTKETVVVDNDLLRSFRESGKGGLILFSSGSTGQPKGILHDFELVCEKFRKQRDPVVAIPFLMIDHFGGINTILSITANQGTVVTIADRAVASVCKAIEEFKVELLPTTPSFLTLLMASNAHKNYDMKSLRLITYGTEVMPQSTLNRVKTAFPGTRLLQTYGLSEVGVLRSRSKDDGSLWVKVGGDGFQTKVVNGILWVKSNFAMVGYLNAPSEFDDEGWFNTQDRVESDGEYIKILGRVTDVINVAGQKVYPSEVEDVILSMDNIADVSVFAEPHELLGNIVVARILTVEPELIENLKPRIRRECKRHLSNYKIPVKFELVEGELYNNRHKKIRRLVHRSPAT